MKVLLLGFLMSVGMNVWGQGITLPDGISGQTEVKLDCDYSAGGKVPAQLQVSFWGEGKSRVRFSLNNTEAIQTSKSYDYIGIDDGMGSHTLYKNKQDLKAGKESGSLILFKYEAALRFNSSLEDVGTRFDNRCRLLSNTTINFVVVEPKCFNRRDKEIDCPKIKY